MFFTLFRVSVVFQAKRAVACLDPRFLSQQPLEICYSCLFFLPVSRLVLLPRVQLEKGYRDHARRRGLVPSAPIAAKVTPFNPSPPPMQHQGLYLRHRGDTDTHSHTLKEEEIISLLSNKSFSSFLPTLLRVLSPVLACQFNL